MTMTKPRFKAPEIENQGSTLTILETEGKKNNFTNDIITVNSAPLLAKTSAKYRNPEVKSYWHYPPVRRSYAYHSDIEQQAKDDSHKIALYNHSSTHPGHYPISNRPENLPRTRKKVGATNPHQQRSQGLRLYLDSLKNEVRVTGEVEFSEKLIDLSWSLWETLKSQLFEVKGLHLEVPDACPGSRDNFMYTWSKAEHYFECEIFGTGEIEFFYRNRNNGQVWGEDTTLEQAFSTDILDKASLFIK
ncbi:hypothetical protein PN499_03065 [Kamptonema animale CS-326]|jgi:hypothetical protein|uniref:hypothetical protein n=1 Tax=Kamptonema animale TaxID=92934 RepID=UPI00232DD7EC|nr:hypothetical protein [Kamptonema animale]MDB9510190.1 hypothetical protein [Kamptonema animale CS-326]